MEHTNHLAELRHLVRQAEEQVATQIQMIDRMERAGLSTADAQDVLQEMRRTVSDLHGRLKILTAV